MGARERKKRQTRERLVEIALEMFVEQGYDATTVEMIAAEAGVSARTFFRYFDTKGTVLADPGSHLMVAAAERLSRVPLAERGVRAVVGVLAELMEDDEIRRPIEILAWSARADSELRGVIAGLRHRWADELATSLAEADGRESAFEERAVCSAAVAVMGSVFDEWFRQGRAVDPLTLVRRAVAVVCDEPGGVLPRA